MTTTWFAAMAGFEAARQIAAQPTGHRSARLHGHSFLTSVRCGLPTDWAGFPGGEVEALRAALGDVVGELDYGCLNDRMTQTDDGGIARWLADRLALPSLAQLRVQSTARSGADLDAQGQVHVWRRCVFQSAHRLPHVPLGHKCGRMHGHGFEVILHAAQGDAGMDGDRLDAAWAPLHMALNYHCLNELPGLENPTSERMSSWIWDRLKPELPQLSSVTVFETASCGANYDGQHYRIWKDMTLDSAVQLRRAPEGSALRQLHGHTYTLRLHLCAPLDQVMGWTVDFGDVKEIFTPLFQALDHRPLYEIADLPDCDTASLSRWILAKARTQLPQLDRVDLYETAGCGAIVCTDGQAPILAV